MLSGFQRMGPLSSPIFLFLLSMTFLLDNDDEKNWCPLRREMSLLSLMVKESFGGESRLSSEMD